MGHTPGPWRVDETKALGSYGVWTDYAVNPGYDGAGYQEMVCSMRPTESKLPREQRDANARLIAAAPDLLAACEMVLDDPGLTESANDVIRAAIAKAATK